MAPGAKYGAYSPMSNHTSSGWADTTLFNHDAESRHPDLYKLVNRDSLFVYSDGKALNAQQRGDGTITVYTSGHRDEDWKKTCGYDLHNASRVKKAMREEFKDWAEPLVKLTQVADEKVFTARSLCVLPPGHRWKHKAKVTLIGDAAHLMTPHAGERVNVAMEDALNPAHAIIGSVESEDTVDALDKEVSTFEDEMMNRAAKVQNHSLDNTKDMYFTPGAPRTVIDIGEGGQWLRSWDGSSRLCFRSGLSESSDGASLGGTKSTRIGGMKRDVRDHCIPRVGLSEI